MNFSLYVLGTPNGYDQYPLDTNSNKFQRVLASCKVESQLSIFRTNQFIQYVYVRKIPSSNDLYFGFCLVLTGVYCLNCHTLNDLFDAAFYDVLMKGRLLRFQKDKYNYTVSKFANNSNEIKRINQFFKTNLESELEKLFVIIPPTFQTGNAPCTLSLKEKAADINAAISQHDVVHLVNDEKIILEIENTQTMLSDTKIPDEANHTIMKAMQLKGSDRYQIVREFKNDLRNTSNNHLQSATQNTLNQKGVSSSSKTAVKEEEQVSANNKKFPLKWLIVGLPALVCIAVVVLVVAFFNDNNKKTQQLQYDEAIAFYRRGVQAYQQGMSNTQGQLDKFSLALDMFDSARFRQNPEFRESMYMDSISVMRGKMFDYCLNEAKANYSGAFLENGLRRNVLNYLNLASQINNTSEVNTLIDSLKYYYISED